jgi:hypothetical protein
MYYGFNPPSSDIDGVFEGQLAVKFCFMPLIAAFPLSNVKLKWPVFLAAFLFSVTSIETHGPCFIFELSVFATLCAKYTPIQVYLGIGFLF